MLDRIFDAVSGLVLSSIAAGVPALALILLLGGFAYLVMQRHPRLSSGAVFCHPVIGAAPDELPDR
jgi:hypothetical protein